LLYSSQNQSDWIGDVSIVAREFQVFSNKVGYFFRLGVRPDLPASSDELIRSVYVPSARMLPGSVASFQYPKSFLTRRVNNSGGISWHKGRVFVSEVLRNEDIGLEQMDEDVHRVFFRNTELGEFNSEDMRLSPVLRI
jgi:hypothetical protein